MPINSLPGIITTGIIAKPFLDAMKKVSPKKKRKKKRGY